ncbi:hypothetical protein C8R48DRAFT_708319 [Suillus tomentosus]|nr:hypothetical protein C8R48DRAFT_708319 [Suillus tomentosus]
MYSSLLISVLRVRSTNSLIFFNYLSSSSASLALHPTASQPLHHEWTKAKRSSGEFCCLHSITCTDQVSYRWLPRDWFKWTTTTMTRGHMAGWWDGGMAGGMAEQARSEQRYPTHLMIAIPIDNVICSH